MDVTVKNERTFVVSMTETQAQNLLNLCCMDKDVGTKNETLDAIRQALLGAGLTQNEDPL